MKKLIGFGLMIAASGPLLAQDMGKVISATPLVQQVAVPRQVCTNEAVAVQRGKSGAGALLGALAGGAMGNAVGQNSGKAAATMLGIMGGAILGERIEGGGSTHTQNMQRCSVQTTFENRASGYNVVYEFGGKQYAVQMQNDPGPFVQLQITPVGSGFGGPASSMPQQAPMQSSMQAPMQSVQPPVVTAGYDTPQVMWATPLLQPVYAVPEPVVYPSAYAQRPYYAPIALSLNLGYGWNGGGHGYRGHRHRH